MNFNASRNVGQVGGLKKAKRVSDVTAMGTLTPAPTFIPGAPYNPSFPPASTPPPFQEGISIDNQSYGAPQSDYNTMGTFGQSPMVSPAQLSNLIQQPVMQDMALQYGEQLARAGGEAMRRELHRVVPVSRLRYYFAVDTRYVLHKLMLLLFPFAHKEWMVKYDQEQPVQPRYDLNAPDLYIPSMGYVTYVLLAGFMLAQVLAGTNRHAGVVGAGVHRVRDGPLSRHAVRDGHAHQPGHLRPARVLWLQVRGHDGVAGDCSGARPTRLLRRARLHQFQPLLLFGKDAASPSAVRGGGACAGVRLRWGQPVRGRMGGWWRGRRQRRRQRWHQAARVLPVVRGGDAAVAVVVAHLPLGAGRRRRAARRAPRAIATTSASALRIPVIAESGILLRSLCYSELCDVGGSSALTVNHIGIVSRSRFIRYPRKGHYSNERV